MAFQSLVTSHSKLLIPAFKLQVFGGAATPAPRVTSESYSLYLTMLQK